MLVQSRDLGRASLNEVSASYPEFGPSGIESKIRQAGVSPLVRCVASWESESIPMEELPIC